MVVVVLVVVVSAMPNGTIRASDRRGVVVVVGQPAGAPAAAHRRRASAARPRRDVSAAATRRRSGRRRRAGPPPRPGRRGRRACSATRARPRPVPTRWRAAVPAAKRSKMRRALGWDTPGPASSTTRLTAPAGRRRRWRCARGRRRAARRCRGGWRGCAPAGACRRTPGARPTGRSTAHRHVVEAVAGGDAPHDVAEEDRLGVELGDAGIEAGDLEEVEHHLVEAVAPGW